MKPSGRTPRPPDGNSPVASFPRARAVGDTTIDLFGIEPTGEGFTVDGIDIFTVEAGEIAEVYAHRNTLGMGREPDVGSAAGSTVG